MHRRTAASHVAPNSGQWNSRRLLLRYGAAAQLAIAACAGTQAETKQGVPSALGHEVETQGVSRPARPWSELTFAQRKQHMNDAVVPTMGPLFLAHDSGRYAEFGCSTCHGPDARKNNYAMPSPSLRVLYPTGSLEQIATVQEHREMAKFMFQRVTPTMRSLLNLPSYDYATGEGFSCFYCHPRGDSSSDLADPSQDGTHPLP